MRQINFELREESIEEQIEGQRFHPALQVITKANGKKVGFTIGAGYSDYVYVAKHENSIYVMSINSRLGYIGVQEYDLLTEVVHDVCFIQDESAQEFIDIEEKSGPTKALVSLVNTFYV